MPETLKPRVLLSTWLLEREPQGCGRLLPLLEELRANPTRRTLFRVLAFASREAGTRALELEPADLKAAEEACPGWCPRGWRCNQMARTLVLLEAAETLPADAFHREVSFLFNAADPGELESLYRALILFPEPRALLAQAMEGTRTNITGAFTALAYDNPYPARFFDEDAWNRMVLKAVFLGLALDPIQGLDQRANRPLARLLLDYVRERWAAHRAARWDLWRCVGPYSNLPAESVFFERLMTTGSQVEQQAAVLSLCNHPSPEAAALCSARPEWIQAALNRRLEWRLLASRKSVEPAAHLAGPI